MSLETSSTRPPEEFPRLPFCPTGFRNWISNLFRMSQPLTTSDFWRSICPACSQRSRAYLENTEISIAAVIQKGRHTDSVPLVMITHDALESSVRKALDEIDNLDVVVAPTVLIRIENKAD